MKRPTVEDVREKNVGRLFGGLIDKCQNRLGAPRTLASRREQSVVYKVRKLLQFIQRMYSKFAKLLINQSIKTFIYTRWD